MITGSLQTKMTGAHMDVLSVKSKRPCRSPSRNLSRSNARCSECMHAVGERARITFQSPDLFRYPRQLFGTALLSEEYLIT